MYYPVASSLRLLVRQHIFLSVKGRKSLTLGLMYPSEFVKTQNELVQNDHWYCSKRWQKVSREKVRLL